MRSRLSWFCVLASQWCADGGPPHRLRQRAGWVSARDPTAAAQRVELIPFTLHFPLFPHRTVARVDSGGVLGARTRLAWFMTGGFSPKAYCREPGLG
eukprot:6195597-Pleurochrysis_carterae.AAC.1